MGKLLIMGYGVVSAFAFFVMLVESISKGYHMPSKELFVISVCGGSFGTLLGMIVFKRKWSRPLFKFGIPILVIIHTAIFSFMMLR